MSRHATQWLLLLAVSTAVFFTKLGATQLWDEDEPIFASTAREMLERGDWVVPVFNGGVLVDKPAGMYWLMMAAFTLFGTTEFAARCGSAAVATATVLLTWRLGRRLFSAAAGFWAAMALATSLNYVVVARAATPDALLVFFSTLALSFLVGRGAPAKPPGWRSLAAFYAAAGLAVLAKGPVGVVLPTATMGLYFLLVGPAGGTGLAEPDGLRPSKRSRAGRMMAALRPFAPGRIARTTWSLRPLTALAVVTAVAGPWYVWVGLRTDGAWLKGFFGVHNFGRFFHAMEHHHGPFFYYVVAAAIGFFPWSLFFVPTVRQVLRRLHLGHRRRRGQLLLISWIAVYVLFFSLARTKLPNYILPIYPALALATGDWVAVWVRRPGLVLLRDVRAAWVLLALVGLATAVGLPLAIQRFLGGDALLACVGLPLVAGAALAWHFTRAGQPRWAACSLAAAAATFSVVLFGWGAVRVDQWQTSARFAECIHRHSTSGAAEIGCFGYYRPSLVFYSRRRVRQLFTPDQAVDFFQEHAGDAFLLASDERYKQLAGTLPADVIVLKRLTWFLRTNEVLLLGRVGSGIVGWDKRAARAPAHQTTTQVGVEEQARGLSPGI